MVQKKLFSSIIAISVPSLLVFGKIFSDGQSGVWELIFASLVVLVFLGFSEIIFCRIAVFLVRFFSRAIQFVKSR